MLSFDLQTRASRFEKQALKHADDDKRKLEKERLARERVAAKKAAHDRAVALQAEKQRAEELLAEQQRLEDTERNNGVYIEATLMAMPLSADAAEARGVKRSADKIVLPAHIGAELMKQSAHENGTVFWEISARDGRKTCCSALDYSGPDGVVILPAKRPCHGEVRVKYRRLDRGTFVRLTPQDSSFQQTVGEHMESLLQDTLMRHTALSEGDWLSVPFAGVEHKLQVMELQPEPHVSLIDTDLSAEVTESREYMDRIQAEQEAAMQAAREEERLREEAARLQDALRAEQQAADAQAAKENAEIALRRSQIAASLAPEPPKDSQEPTLLARFNLPDGSKVQRRFALNQSMSAMFDFVESCGAGGWRPSSYRLVTTYPRRVFAEGTAQTLHEAGLSPGQNVFLLELV